MVRPHSGRSSLPRRTGQKPRSASRRAVPSNAKILAINPVRQSVGAGREKLVADVDIQGGTTTRVKLPLGAEVSVGSQILVQQQQGKTLPGQRKPNYVVVKVPPLLAGRARRFFKFRADTAVNNRQSGLSMMRRFYEIAREAEVAVPTLLDVLSETVSRSSSRVEDEAPIDRRDEEILAEAGILQGPKPRLEDTASFRTDLRMSLLAEAGASREEVAKRLGISPDTVTKMAAERSLLSVKKDGRLRFPAVQFTQEGDLIPHLGAVLNEIPDGMHWLGAVNFLSRPHGDLQVADSAVSPAVWLSEGNAPGPVLELARELDSGF